MPTFPSRNFRPSVLDKFSRFHAKTFRKVTDRNLIYFATQAQILRITPKVRTRKTTSLLEVSVLGDFSETLAGYVVHSLAINYPFNAVEVFQDKDFNQEQAQTSIAAIDIETLLPITVTMKFDGKYEEDDPIEFFKNDLIVDTFFDHHGNLIPVILQFQRFRGSFFGKDQISKTAEVSLYRKQLEQDAQTAVDLYLDYIKNSRQE